MLERANRTFICSVVFLDIVEYSKKPVAEQMKLKDRFNSLISEAIQDIAVNDRIILDTGDGVAISFLGDPEDALFVAMSLRDAMKNGEAAVEPQLFTRIGIHLGPVKLVRDINGQPNIIGDGINVAQRVMSFSQPGQVLVSRSYYDVVSCLSQEYAQLFNYEGSRTDKHVREHEVYAVGYSSKIERASISGEHKAKAGKERPLAVYPTGPSEFPPSQESGVPEKVTTPAASGWWSNRKLWWVAAPLAAVIIFFLGFMLRGGKAPSDSGKAETPVISSQTPKPPPSASADADRPRPPKPPFAKDREAAPPEASAAGALAFVGLAVTPWGEVYVDGKKQGISPPLKVIQVTPGKHKIEIRNSSFAPYTQTIEVKPKDRVMIKHKFR